MGQRVNSHLVKFTICLNLVKIKLTHFWFRSVRVDKEGWGVDTLAFVSRNALPV